MKTVKDFKDYDFENCDVPEEYWGDYTHANYFKKAFIPIARKEFKALAKKLGAELIFSPMYFEWSAFFKKDGKFIYVHVGDVRYNICGHWYDRVLYRTAKSEYFTCLSAAPCFTSCCMVLQIHSASFCSLSA